MRAPLLIFLAVVLVAGSGMAIMNGKSGYRTWCAQTSGIRHHLKAGLQLKCRRRGAQFCTDVRHCETAKARTFQQVAGPIGL